MRSFNFHETRYNHNNSLRVHKLFGRYRSQKRIAPAGQLQPRYPSGYLLSKHPVTDVDYPLKHVWPFYDAAHDRAYDGNCYLQDDNGVGRGRTSRNFDNNIRYYANRILINGKQAFNINDPGIPITLNIWWLLLCAVNFPVLQLFNDPSVERFDAVLVSKFSGISCFLFLSFFRHFFFSFLRVSFCPSTPKPGFFLSPREKKEKSRGNSTSFASRK